MLMSALGWPGGAAVAGLPDAPAFTARPLWGGLFVPGGTTEIRIALRSETGGGAQVSIHSGTFSLTAEVEVPAERTRTLALPLRPAPDGRVTLSARWPDGTSVRASLTLRPVPARAPLMASSRPDRSDLGPTTAIFDTADLPRTTDGYGPIGALRLSPGDLASLDPAQTQALALYLGECRPLHLFEAVERDRDRIRAASGCGGRGVTADPDQVGSPRDAPSVDWPDAALQIGRVWPLRDGQDSERGRAGLLLLPYAMLLTGLLLMRRPGSWVLAVPGAATVLVWLTLPQVLGPARSLTWVESESGDPVARFVTLIQTRGQGRTPEPIRLSAGAAIPTALDEGPMQLHLTEAGTTLPGSGPLFQRRRYLLRGVARAPLDLGLRVTERGYAIRKPGDVTPTGVWLLDRGCAWPVRGLPIGEAHWDAPTGTPPNPRRPGDPVPFCPAPPSFSPPAGSTPALLVNLTPDLWPALVASAPGPAWLVIRPAARAP
ncbi:hypothetical protein THSYN_14925 [Candidatus Thiodictyon syntrophicum]|jgi:hypothetical protein|uniref:Uncharacterized protein n=2 Tax=Candidatus Thiodictyon syntrophicum TaxID=1166950 RepID=A0A2K8U973_9GAMM|nr:hypothetical protein THSYN_14925 [Candidatus Thiodictyon syntrophicum]